MQWLQGIHSSLVAVVWTCLHVTRNLSTFRGLAIIIENKLLNYQFLAHEWFPATVMTTDHLFFVGHVSCTPYLSHYIHQILNWAFWQASSGHIVRCGNNSRKFTNYKDMHNDDSCICEAICLLLFFQVIRVRGKYMHRQTRSYQGDLIQWVQDISLIGLSSISHAQKASVSSHHTLLLWNFLSWREKAPQGKNCIS